MNNLCRPSCARSRPARLLVSLPSHSMSRHETKALLALHFFAWVGWPSVVDETCSALSVVGGRASATPRQCCFFVALFPPASSLQFRGAPCCFCRVGELPRVAPTRALPRVVSYLYACSRLDGIAACSPWVHVVRSCLPGPVCAHHRPPSTLDARIPSSLSRQRETSSCTFVVA